MPETIPSMAKLYIRVGFPTLYIFFHLGRLGNFVTLSTSSYSHSTHIIKCVLGLQKHNVGSRADERKSPLCCGCSQAVSLGSGARGQSLALFPLTL